MALPDTWVTAPRKSMLSNAGERFYYSATVDTRRHVLHLKLVNASSNTQSLTVQLIEFNGEHAAHLTELHAATYEATNTLARPDAIYPVASEEKVVGAAWKHTVPALSIEVVDIPLQ